MIPEVMISFCDKSGIMAEPWAEAGYTCYCVDLQHPVRKEKVREFEGGGRILFSYGDARYWLPPKRSKAIFFSCFPTCTDLCKSGAQDFSNTNGRIPKKGLPQLCDGLMLFNACYMAASWSGAPFLVENSSGVIHTHFRKPDYTFQPWFYGADYQKLTCLWTGNGFKMPAREVFEKPDFVTQKIWEMAPSDERAEKRSETSRDFARAVFEANCKKELA